MIFLAVVMKSQENVTCHSGFFIDFSCFYQKFAVHRIANAIDYPRSFAVTSIPSREEVHPAGCLKSPISITMKKTFITLLALAGVAAAVPKNIVKTTDFDFFTPEEAETSLILST